MNRRASPLILSLVVAFAATAGLTGCTIYTSTTTGAPKHQSRPRAHRPPPPAAPRPAPAAGKPSPAPSGPAKTVPSTRPDVTDVKRAPDSLVQPKKEDPPSTRTRAQQLPPGIGTGRPRGFRPDAPPAYWIWQGPRGHWRLRTTSKDQPHVFRGYIHPIETRIGDIQPSRNEFRDRIWKSGDGWAFSFKTKSHADGFTFAATDNGCVRFDLQLDGGPERKRIFVGAKEYQPSSNHFVVCPKNAPSLKARPTRSRTQLRRRP
jgi:hypothetical protein